MNCIIRRPCKHVLHLCVLFFQEWQERYIHENYTHIMKDKLIETVSCYTS